LKPRTLGPMASTLIITTPRTTYADQQQHASIAQRVKLNVSERRLKLNFALYGNARTLH
jgi:hypothetical protein